LKNLLKLSVIAVVMAFATLAFGQTLSGTVTNGTTGKPAGGDDVILIKLANGMEEAARTKADSQGKFSFKMPDDGGPHLIRVVHQGVTYHKMAPPGTTSVQAQVYDSAKKIDGLSVTADVMRIQAQDGKLQVARLFAVNNASQPPRTQMNDHNFEFYLPEGAQIEESAAKTAGGQPLTTAPVPQADKNRFAFVFPLRPGETQFQIQYQLPYSGQMSLDPKSLYAMEHFVVMLPKSMKFSGPASFQSMQDPQQSDSQVEVVSNAQPSQSLAFKISGTGVLPDRNEGGTTSAGGGQGQVMGPEAGGNRPGGGLGPPIDAPDPLSQYRWYILGGFALVLAGGGYYIAKRSPAQAEAAASIDDAETVEVPRAPAARTAKPTGKATAAAAAPARANGTAPSMLLQALKEELFELELERQQGRISPQEYEKNKAALDQTLQRALKREAQKV
jgi:hypothetical protein